MWSFYSISPMWLYGMLLRHRDSSVFNSPFTGKLPLHSDRQQKTTENMSQCANYRDAVQTSDLTTAPSCLLVMSSGGVSWRSYVAIFIVANLSLSFWPLDRLYTSLPQAITHLFFPVFLCPCQRTLQSSCYHSIPHVHCPILWLIQTKTKRNY